MKKTSTPQRPKSRFGKVLFAKDSPFKHQVVKDRTKYTRKDKFKEPLSIMEL